MIKPLQQPYNQEIIKSRSFVEAMNHNTNEHQQESVVIEGDEIC